MRTCPCNAHPGAHYRDTVTPACDSGDVVAAVSPGLHFAHTARRLGLAARAADLVVPAFRSPPRRGDVTRAIRRLPGGVVVSVRVNGRSFADIDADMVDGVLAANSLSGEAAARVRHTLLSALSRDAAASEAA
jgi:hypothetical protein